MDRLNKLRALRMQEKKAQEEQAAQQGRPASPQQQQAGAPGQPGSPARPQSPRGPAPVASPMQPGTPRRASPMPGSPAGVASPRAPGQAAPINVKELSQRLGQLTASPGRPGMPPGTPIRVQGSGPGSPMRPQAAGPPGTPIKQPTAPGTPVRASVGPGTPTRQPIAPGAAPVRPPGSGTPIKRPGTGSGSPPVIPTEMSFVTVPPRTRPSAESKSDSASASPARRISPHSITPPEAPQKPVEYRGKAGRPVAVGCNYIRLEQADDRGLFEYAVNFEGGVDSRDERFQLIKQLEDKIGKVKSFDGTKLFLPITLDPPSFRKTLKSPNSGKDIVATVSFKAQRHPGEMVVIQHFNILFNRVMKILKFNMYNRKHFDPKGGHIIAKHKLQVWPGYVTAVDQYEGGLHLMLDVTHRVIRNQNVRDVLASLRTKGASMKTEADRHLLGATIITAYNNKSYKIDDIAWDITPKSKFERDGEEGSITIEHYYKTRYNLQIKDLDQPLLINRPKVRSESETEQRQLWLVPEFCMMTGLTDAQRADFKLMSDVAKFTRVTPEDRMKSMMKFVNNVLTNPDANAVLTNWGLHLNAKTAQIQARQLDSETLLFGKNQAERVNPKGDWNRAACSKPLLTPAHLKKWTVLFVKKDEATVMKFLQAFKEATGKSGMQVMPPTCQALPDDRTDTYLKAAREAIQPQVDLIITVFPQQRADRYSAIKKLCYIERPIASQVIITKTINNEKRLSAVAQKIGIQVNCKLGGEAWGSATAVKIKGLMVIGVDVYKDASKKGTYVGMVATLNPPLSKFYSGVVLQKEGSQYIADAVRPIFLEALLRFRDQNNAWPRNIVVFRDGAGDGQLDMIAQHEADQFLRVFDVLRDPNIVPQSKVQQRMKADLTADTVPGFTYVVVQKRINTRIFGKKGAGFENPACGTIIDHTITRLRYKDFFLVPMSVAQGTATPTHFIVVKENSQADVGGKFHFPPDHVQRLSYLLTHMYFNWPGTVRVPAPCQYAHKLVDMVGENLHNLPSDKLADKLFYL